VCHLLRSGVAALFGPQSGTTSSHVQSICDAMEIPHIETRWDYRLRRDDYSVNLYPHPQDISKVQEKGRSHPLSLSAERKCSSVQWPLSKLAKRQPLSLTTRVLAVLPPSRFVQGTMGGQAASVVVGGRATLH